MDRRKQILSIIEAHPMGVLSLFERHGIYDIPTVESVEFWASKRGESFLKDLSRLTYAALAGDPDMDYDFLDWSSDEWTDNLQDSNSGSSSGGWLDNFLNGANKVGNTVSNLGNVWQSIFTKKQDTVYVSEPGDDNSKTLIVAGSAMFLVLIIVMLIMFKKSK